MSKSFSDGYFVDIPSYTPDSDTDHEEYSASRRVLASVQNRSRLLSFKTPRTLNTLGLLALTTVLASTTAFYASRAGLAQTQVPASHRNDLDAIRNSTLGFEKIYSVSLPHHWHKRDGQLLAARYTGIDVENFEGVHWKDIPETEYPLWWHDPYNASIGCWRAHMNLLAKIVEEGIGSALILEDDADWDVFLKPQLQEFARGALELQGTPSSTRRPPSISPYGDAWDFLWVGACSYDQPYHDHRYYLVSPDPTVAPINRRHTTWDGPERITSLNNTRTIFRAGYGSCTTGYAVTQAAARRMLTAISLPPNVEESAIDRKYGRMCAHNKDELPLNCFGVYPPLLSMHRFAGLLSADSEIEDHSKEDEVHPEYAHDIVYSTTMNLLPVAKGAKTYRSQWPDETLNAEVPLNAKLEWEGKTVFIDPFEE